MDRFFYRINNILIAVIILFIGVMVVSSSKPVHSAQDLFARYFANSDDTTITQDSAPIVINKIVNVDFDPSNYRVAYLSDGNTSSISPEQKTKINSGQLDAIPVPLTFDISTSYVELPGEYVYPVVKKGTAPQSYICNPKEDPNDTVARENCLYNVTALSVFTDLTKRDLLLSANVDAKTTIENDGSIFDNLTRALEIISSLNQYIAAVTGVPDQQRSAIGTVEWWADDELQQLARINNSTVIKSTPNVHSTAVNASEGYFASDLSRGIEASVTQRNMRINIYEGVKEDIGFSNFADPLTSVTDVPGNDASESVIEAIGNFITKVTSPDFKPVQKQKKLSVQVAMRTISESDEFTVSYNFCDALEQNGLLRNYTEYSNPFSGPSVDPLTGEMEDPTTLYNNYQKLSSKTKRCITAIQKYVDEGRTGNDTRAASCARQLAENPGNGCQEFSVEDDGLSFSMIQSSLPIGFGSYFQNGTLNDLNPNLDGPFYNYLSPYFCAKLNIVYKISTDKSYIYSFGGKNQSVDIKKAPTKEVNNQYCVISSLLSNFSWAMAQQEQNFGSNNYGTINLPKEALTCDKKEVAIIGGSFAKSNIQSPGGQLVYINQDNVRGEQDSEDVLLNHGYTPISFRDIVNDPDIDQSIYKYRDSDVKALVDPQTQSVKYVLLTVKKKDNDMRLALCKVKKSDPLNPDEKVCKILLYSEWILPGDVGLVHQNGVDYITIVDYKGLNDDGGSISEDEQLRNSSNGGSENNAPRPVRYMFVEVEKSDITTAKITESNGILADGAYSRWDSLQLSKGTLAVAVSQFVESKLISLNVYELDPINRKVKNFSGDICAKFSNLSQCSYLSNLQSWINPKLAQDSSTGSLYLTMTANGVGIVYPLEVTNNENTTLGYYIFGYKNKSASYNDSEDYISAIKVTGSEMHIFMQNSGFYLRVIFPWMKSNLQNLEQIKKDLADKCKYIDGTQGNNCLITLQYEFNPEIFTTDCSDYYGRGACGYPELSELGTPIVLEFNYSSGKIHAWYKYSKLRNTLFESQDMTYAFTGVYTQLKDEEYSNAYVINTTAISTNSKNNLPVIPMRYLNYSTGLRVGHELIQNGNIVTENIPVMRPDKYRCFQNMAKITGVDIFTSQTGLSSVNVNNASILNPTVPTSSNTSTLNNGMYCEETWCVPDEIDFTNNAMFGGDNNDTLKSRIVEFFLSKKAGNATTGTQYESLKQRYTSKVDTMCAKAAIRNVSCAFLAAIWYQESGGSLADNAAVLGCMGESVFGASWRSFETQIDCAIGSLKSSATRYANGDILSGPGSLYTPNLKDNGQCKPATLFSMAMQRYTPIDHRINFNNQCNRGLVQRNDQGQCLNDNLVAGADRSETAFNAGSTNAKWPSGVMTGSRKNLQEALIFMDSRLRADNKFCFPGTTSSGGIGTTGNADVEAVKKAYGLTPAGTNEYTSKTGVFKMNLGAWGKSWAAGNVQMALDGNINNRGIDGPGGILGTHIVKPGSSFSFNDILGNPSDSEVIQRQSVYEQAGYNFTGETVIGGGWCELATTIGEAARSEDYGVHYKDMNGQIKKLVYGEHIRFKDHGLPKSNFNDQLSIDGYQLKDDKYYVSIWSLGYQTDADNDLVITNPFPADSGVDMVIAVTKDSKTVITVEIFFGKNGSQSSPTPTN